MNGAADRGDDHHATWLELFFDLVFVLAVAVLAHKLEEDHSVSGYLGFAGLFVPVWWSWVTYSASFDRFGTDDVLMRVLAMAGMLAIGAMAVSLEDTLHGGDVAFVISYLLVRVVLVSLYMRAAALRAPLAAELTRSLAAGSVLAATVWVGSLLVSPPDRYALWAAAVAIEIAIPFARRATVARAPVDESHVGERYGLFTIIVLGETVIAVGTGVAGTDWQVRSVVVAALAFVAVASLWWSYFGLVAGVAETHSFGAHMAYVLGHFPIVVGITAMGAGILLAIDHAGESILSAGERWALLGGSGVFMLAIAVVSPAARAHRLRALPMPLAVACAAFALAGAGPALAPVLLVAVLVAALLIAVVAQLRLTGHHRRSSLPPT